MSEKKNTGSYKLSHLILGLMASALLVLSSCLKTIDVPFNPKVDPAQTVIYPKTGQVVNPSNQIVMATDFPLATIYYSLDGSSPGKSSGTVYESPFTLLLTASPVTIQARAIKPDGEEGPITTSQLSLIAPVGYWKMNESSGLIASDASGNANNGTLGSGAAITWGAGVSGNAGYFSRVGGLAYQISCGTAPACNTTAALTLSAWVKPNALSNTSLIVAKYSWNVDGYVFFLTTTGQPYFYTFNANAISKTATSGVSTGVWSHVAVTYAFPTIRFYINGNSAGSFTTTGTIASPTTRGLQINTTYNPNFLDGAIDNVRVYNVALTDEQIKDLYLMEQ